MRVIQVQDGKGNVLETTEVPYTEQELKDYNEKKREELIAQGTTFDGITVKNDDRTLLFFTNLIMQANADSNFSYSGFNAINGRFDLTNTQIKGLYTAGQAAIIAAFNIYNSVDEAIKAGTITTTQEIDSEYEA